MALVHPCLLSLAAVMALVFCDQNASHSASLPGPPAAQEGGVMVASAANLKPALDAIRAGFHEKYPAIDIKVTYGSSGNLRAQIHQGAPFDLFLSADLMHPESLVSDGKASEEDLFVYALGSMVLWVRHSSGIDVERLQERSLLDPSVRKIAIANPEHAPYGQAAVAALKHYGIYEEIASRFVLAENIAQTAQFVESGAADIGVIALSLAVAPVMMEKGRYWKIPLENFPRMTQGGVIPSTARNREGAVLLREYLLSAPGREILQRYGFILPEDAD